MADRTAPVSSVSPVDPAQALNWSALKDFLVVAETGSLSGAARRLGVSQPTLTRRMAALEQSLGAELFQRSSRGLSLTETGEALLAPARQMQSGAQAVELLATGRDRRLSGLVRLTATEGVAVDWLTPALGRLRAEHPLIEVQVIVRNTAVNVLRREADIAIRLGRPQQQELVARRVAELTLGLYGARRYLDAHGVPQSVEDLAQHTGVGFDEIEVFTAAGGWLERMIAPARVVYRANTLGAQRAAIRAGFGIGGQARFIADRDPDLMRVLPEIEIRLDIWLVTHPGLRGSARIRATYDFLAEELVAARSLLSGDAPTPRADSSTPTP